jgi:enterochelin esterase family protein
MVFQDGHDYVNLKGNWRVPIVFDNLIHKGEMPVTIAILISPGHDPSKGAKASPWKASNRSYEYDSLGDRYARFLLEEILPEVGKKYNLSTDPDCRAICGASSGGICSFTVAWERPDQFRKVLSTIGSFTNLRGGHDYVAQIRKTERKPLRVFMQDGANDVDNPFGSWPIANQQVQSSLRYMGYDTKLVWGEGEHNSKHGGSVFPDALRWLWRDEKHQPQIKLKGDLGGDLTLHRRLIDGENWELVAEGLTFADAPCADDKGNFLFCDMRSQPPVVWQVAPSGEKKKLIEGTPCSGLKFGPDGRLYGCVGKEKQLVAFDLPSGKKTVIAENVQPNDLAITHTGLVFFTETGKKQVSFVNVKTGEVKAADVGITAPNGITLSPDQGILAVSDARGSNVWRFRIHPDGTLSAKERYMTMRLPIDPKGEFKFHESPPKNPASGGDGMTSDTIGRFYVATSLGVQVFDPTGRMCGVLPKPSDKGMTSVGLAGPKREYLYATCNDKVFRRRVQATGVLYFQSPQASAAKP